MGNLASVFDINSISNAMSHIEETVDEADRVCSEEITDSNKVFNQAQEEEKISANMLDAAKAIEAIALASMMEKEAEMAKAAAEEAGALTSGNPAFIVIASAKLAEATSAFQKAKEKYEESKNHREQLDRRHELAIKCVNLASQMLEEEKTKFNFILSNIKVVSERGIYRLSVAKTDLEKYVSRMSPSVKKDVEDWENWKPSKNVPVEPKRLHDRLNVGNGVLQAILAYLYATDENFRSNVNNYRNQGAIEAYRSEVDKKIKKNMTGRLCEEIVIRAFEPLGESVETQGRTYLEDGSYTKTDLIVKNLSVPVILGRGEGMGAREGADLAVEVKSGHKEYLYAQKEHMEKQAKGHASSDISCTVCTRDIKSLSPEKEKELRLAMAKAGSPLLGMLPTKDDLDSACIEFVFGDDKNV